MTRKQALQKALEVVSDPEVAAKIGEILAELPLVNWTERAIFDTIDQFIADNGRNPATGDFARKGMPPHTVIKLRFGVTLGEFLAEHYPQPAKNPDEYRRLFVGEYERIMPTSAGEFNRKRGEGVPTWGTFAKLFGLSKWLELVEFCSPERSSPTLRARKRHAELSVKSYVDLEE